MAAAAPSPPVHASPFPFKVQVYKAGRWMTCDWLTAVTETEANQEIAALSARGERARMVVR